MQTTTPPSLDGTTTADIKAQRERDFERGIFSTKKQRTELFIWLRFSRPNGFALFVHMTLNIGRVCTYLC